MPDLMTIAVGAVAVILLVGGLIYLGRRGVFDPSGEGEETRDELRERSDSEDWSIPLRRRYKALPGPARAMAVILGLLTLGAIVALVRFFRTGAPASSFLTREWQFATVAVVGVVGGVWVARWFDGRRSTLWVEYESQGSEPTVEEIPFMKNSIESRNGDKIVKELGKGRLFGLFSRYRQVGERRELRGNNSLPSDRIQHRVPPHATELPNGDIEVETRPDGDVVLGGGAEADKTYRSQNEMSREEAIRIRNRMQMLQTKSKARKAKVAELHSQVNKLEKAIENEEYRQREDLINDLNEMMEAFKPFMDSQGFGGGFSPASTLQAAENGEEAEQ